MTRSAPVAPVRAYSPPLQALLFWQVCVVCGVLGLLAVHWFQPALLALGLLIWADSRLHILPFRPIPSRALVRLALILPCFASAWFAGTTLMPPAEPVPTWALAHTADKSPPRLRGVVEKVQGLTDQRVRIILNHVTLDADTTTPHSLKGKMVWTWDNSPQRPLVGETWAFSLPVAPTGGFSNAGLADWAFTARAEDHLWRVWSKEQRGNPRKLDHVSAAATPSLERERLRQKFFAVLSPVAQPIAQSVVQPAEAAAASDTTGNTKADLATISQARAIIPALLFGDRSALHTATIDLFTRATLVHSLALSGQHLAVTLLLATVLMSVAARWRATMFLHVPRHKAIVACALPLALLYLWLGNAPDSLQRAACMMALLSLCLWRNAPATTLDILCGAVLCLLLWDPLSVFALGLQLSVICVGSIALVMPLLRSLPRPPLQHTIRPPSFPSRLFRISFTCARALVCICAISCTIQVALLPVSLLVFHTASPWFFLNVLWLPVLGCVVLPASVLALACVGLNLSALAALCISVAAWPCDLLLRLLHWLNSHHLLDETTFLRPHWTSLLGYTALLIAAAMLWGRPHLPPASRRLALAGAVLLLVGPLLRYSADTAPHVSLHMLDVGQGQALALQVPHGKRILVDGGGFYSSRFNVGQALVSPTLTYNSPPRVDSLINTHPHMDHLQGLLHINEKFHGQSWYDNTTLAAGDQLLLSTSPRIVLDVLHPPRNIRYLAENDNSLVLRVVLESPSGSHGLALLTGDIEQQALHELLTRNNNLQADVLVLPHHGSKTSYSPDLYDAVKPRVALISAGANNRYGSPAPQVLAALAARSIRICTTARDGDVRIMWDVGAGIEGGGGDGLPRFLYFSSK